MANVFYVFRKTVGVEEARRRLQKLRSVVDVIPMNKTTVDQALAMSGVDFEDALQYCAARENKLTTVITRNLRDYQKFHEITAQSAADYLAQFNRN